MAQKLGIPKIQFTNHMKPKKEEDQSVDTSFLLRMGNKIPMEGVTETKCGVETEDHPETAPLGDLSHKQPPNPDTRQMPTRACLQEPYIDVSCEALSVPGKYRSGCSQSSIGWNTGPLKKELEEIPKELKRKNNNMN